MPWDLDHPPAVAKNWTTEEQTACIAAANRVLQDTGDDAKAVQACIHAAGKSKNQSRIDSVNTLEAEIFAVGKWNGLSFSADDLDRIVDAFNELDPIHKVPLKFGHNDKQPITDGQPALGWVSKVYRKGTKLLATLTDVPDIVKRAFERKLYRKVSIELDLDVQHKGKDYRHVLSAVALLGADLPAVNTLADLAAYMGRGRPLVAGGHGLFSAIRGELTGDTEMDEKQIEAMIDKAVGAAVKPMQEENTALKAQVAKFTKDAEDRTRQERDAKVKANREMANNLLEAAVKQNHIKPAQRTTFAKALRLEDDDAALKVTKEDIEGLIGTEIKAMSFNEQGRGSGAGDGTQGGDEGTQHKREHDDPGLEIDRRANIEIARSGGKLNYRQARDAVMSDDGELAREYMNANTSQ